MILYKWVGHTPNFGDGLNDLLWPQLLPDFFDTDPSARFLGIGSVLDSRHDGVAAKLVSIKTCGRTGAAGAPSTVTPM